MARKKRPRDVIASKIKDIIVARNLQPGDLLPTELELCNDLKVSRSSVREAIRSLVTLGIVEVRHGHGTFVAEINLDSLVETVVFRGIVTPVDNFSSLAEVVDIRKHLELAYADKLIAAFKGKEHPDLRDLVETMIRKAAERKNFTQEDRAFHIGLFERTENTLMVQLVGAFWDIHTAILPQLGLSNPQDLTATAKAHGAMLDALEKGSHDDWFHSVIAHYEPLLDVIEREKG